MKTKNIELKNEGHFVDCINPFGKPIHAFYSHIPPTQSDLAKLCGMCWYIAGHQKQITMPGPLKKTRVDAKPERDTL